MPMPPRHVRRAERESLRSVLSSYLQPLKRLPAWTCVVALVVLVLACSWWGILTTPIKFVMPKSGLSDHLEWARQFKDKRPGVGYVRLPQGFPPNDPIYDLNGLRIDGSGSSTCEPQHDCIIPRWLHTLFDAQFGCEEMQPLLDEIDECVADAKAESEADPDAPEATCSIQLGKGFWRDAYLPLRTLPDGRSVVIRIMKEKHSDNVRNALRHYREAIALHHVRKNPYVIPLIGHCNGTITATEFGGVTLEDHILSTSNSILSKTLREVINMCHQVIKGVEALHTIDPPFIHADIQPRQFLMMDGRIRINDLNRGKFLPFRWVLEDDRIDKDGRLINGERVKQMCRYCGSKSKGRWRAPEEYAKTPLNEKLDIYSVAMTYLSMFMGDKVMLEIPKSKVYTKIMDGYRPSIPKCVPTPMQHLMRRMWAQNPDDRPSATEVAFEIQRMLRDQTISWDETLINLGCTRDD